MRLTRIKWGLAIAMLLAAPATAQEAAMPPLPPLQPYNSHAYYDVSWSGIRVGGMVIDASEDADSYAMTLKMKSDGLAWVLTKHHSTTTVEGIRRGGRYLPQRFETWFTLRKKTRHIVLDYDRQGRLVHEINTPPEDPNKRKPVPLELKREVVDALSVFFVQRPLLYEALEQGKERFTLRMYDGRRLTDMNYQVKGRQHVDWNNRKTAAVVFALSRTPVAGFKKSELEDLQNKKDPAVTFYLSDDGTLTPLRIVIDASAGRFYGNFRQNCASAEACDALLK